jgi:hypothetical protein
MDILIVGEYYCIRENSEEYKMPKVERSVIEDRLRKFLDEIKLNRKIVTDIKRELTNNKIPTGQSQKWISGITSLSELELRELCLLMSVAYNVTLPKTEINSSAINPENYFATAELRNSEVYEKIRESRKIEFPYTFRNKMIKVRDRHWTGIISARELKDLNDSGLIFYNYDCQREANQRTSKEDPDIMIKSPKVSQTNVVQMAKLMQTGRLESTTIVLNARMGTALGDEEIIYDEDDLTLTITDGVFLDILDGFNRLTTINAVLSDPNYNHVDMNFEVRILNYDIEEAINHFSQINKGMKIAKSKLDKVESTNNIYSFIAERVQNSSELRDKVSVSENVPFNSNFLLPFSVLKDAIQHEFKIEENDKPSGLKLAKYLSKFLDELFMSNGEAFMTKIPEIREESLINTAQMFYGYIVLARRFQENNIDIAEIGDVISSINFDRQNQIWHELGVVDEKGNISGNARGGVRKFFNSLNIGEVKTSA